MSSPERKESKTINYEFVCYHVTHHEEPGGFWHFSDEVPKFGDKRDIELAVKIAGRAQSIHNATKCPVPWITISPK